MRCNLFAVVPNLLNSFAASSAAQKFDVEKTFQTCFFFVTCGQYPCSHALADSTGLPPKHNSRGTLGQKGHRADIFLDKTRAKIRSFSRIFPDLWIFAGSLGSSCHFKNWGSLFCRPRYADISIPKTPPLLDAKNDYVLGNCSVLRPKDISITTYWRLKLQMFVAKSFCTQKW